jgi:hypothetical protein
MANSNETGFVDKHIEKVFLGLGVVVLLYAVVTFGLATPRRLEVMGESVQPSKVDETILSKARSLKQRVLAAQPKPVEQRDDLARLKPLHEGVEDANLARVSYGSPLAKGLQSQAVETDFRPVTIAELQKVMPPPSQPAGWVGVELIINSAEAATGTSGQTLSEQLTWRAAAVYPWDQLQQAWDQAMKGVLVTPRLVALRYEVQIEMLAGNGQWTPVDPQKLELYRVKNPETGRAYTPPPIPDFNGENTSEIRDFLLAWQQSEWPAYLLQPQFRPIWIGGAEGSWQRHFPAELVKQAYPQETTDEQASPSQRPGAPGPMGGPTRRTPTRAPRRSLPMGQPDMAMPSGTAPGAEAEPEVVEIPPLATQIQRGKVLMWFHATNIDFGQTYRCRFRMVFANPILGESDAVPEDQVDQVSQKTVTSPWSPWSQSETVQQEVEFFLTGEEPDVNEPQNSKLIVTIFSRKFGQAVKHAQRGLEPGQTIGVNDVEVQVTDPLTNEPAKPRVDFQADAMAVDFLFNRRVYAGSERVQDNGTELIYLDRNGKLARRLLPQDKNTDKFKELNELAEQVRREVTGEPDRTMPASEDDRRHPVRTPTRRGMGADMPPGDMMGEPGPYPQRR